MFELCDPGCSGFDLTEHPYIYTSFFAFMNYVKCFFFCGVPNSMYSVFFFLKFTISLFSSSEVAKHAKSSVRLGLMVENDLSEV